MAAPATVVWNLDPHTQAKHVILRKYLDQWLPILSHGGFPKVVFIDRFAGPGIYEDGSDGSPTIALKAFLEHSSPITTQVHFHFIEQDTHRAILKREIVRLFEKHARPSNLHCSVHSGESFEDAYGKIVGCKETVGAHHSGLDRPVRMDRRADVDNRRHPRAAIVGNLDELHVRGDQ